MPDILAAVFGAIIGTSLSPEVWIAVAVVVAVARTSARFWAALVLAACGLIALRYALLPAFSIANGMATIGALMLWSLIGWGIRVAVTSK